MLDSVLTSFTKDCISGLLPLITRIVNSSLYPGTVSRQSKNPIVTPLLKKPRLDPNDMKHICPVSNLPYIFQI